MIKASIVLLLGCCAIPWLRRRSAAERHMLWAATLGTAAVLPVLNLLVPSWQPDWARHVTAVLPTSFGPGPIWIAGQSTDIVVRANAIEPTTWALSRVLLGLWAIGAAIAVLTLAAEAVKLARCTRSAQPLSDGRWHQVVADLAHALRLRRPIQLLKCAHGSVPMTWGMWRPRVLLPACATEWSDDRKRAVLAHELAHVGRGDWIVQVLSELSCAVYWFNPLFWIARNRLCRESEHACDDVVLNLGIEGTDYAAHLLEIVRAAQSPQRAWSPSLAMARPSHLEQRFAALLKDRANRSAVSRRRAVAALVVTMLLVLPLAAMSVPGDTKALGAMATIEVRTANLPTTRETGSALNTRLSVTTIPQVRAATQFAAATGITTKPEILEYSTPPLYSDQARAQGIEGIVTVEARVDVHGDVHVVRVVKGLGFGLDQNALVALRHWRFLPGTRNGIPTEMTADIDIEFSLRNEALNELIANDMATRVGPGVTPPRAVRTVGVRRSGDARTRGRQGTVILDVVLLEDGSPRIVRILQPLDAERDDSAVRAFEQWRFSPAMKHGRPVKVRMNVEVNFHG